MDWVITIILIILNVIVCAIALWHRHHRKSAERSIEMLKIAIKSDNPAEM